MRLTLLISLFSLVPFVATPARAAQRERSATIHAILVIASNERGGRSDPRLAPYEPTLKRVLRYESYRAIGEGSAAVAGTGTAVISLAGGNRVELVGDHGSVKVRHGGTEVPVAPGQPVVLLGGAAGGKGEVYAIIVTAN